MGNYDLEQELNLDNYSDGDKELIMAEVEQRIGDKVFTDLPEHKAHEFQEIAYDNIEHINWWLGENDPDYRENPAFQDTVEVINEDGNPDNIRPEKVYAIMRWIEVNVPNYNEIVKEVIDAHRDRDWTDYLAERR